MKREPAAGRGLVRAALIAADAAVAARGAYEALRRYPPGGEQTWTRVNHRGEPVTLLEGPAVAAGAVAAVLLSSERKRVSARTAMALAGAGAAGFGVYDDLAGSGKRRGLRGHLGALAQGEVTTGSVKLGGIGATGLASAMLLGGGRSDPHGGPAPHTPWDVVVNAGLVAGGANLLNLFDLRPGRAIKVATLSAALISAGGGRDGAAAVAAPLGAALAMAPDDLGERAMLGDAGANALGAMLGCAAAASLSRPARIALLAGIVALTAASEKVSFTKVIERTPALRWLDMLGRRPAVVVPAQRRDPEPMGVGTGRSGDDSGTGTRQES
ncbi:MAG TPA: hypothetical protein VH589_12380 [Trebonia sp.]